MKDTSINCALAWQSIRRFQALSQAELADKLKINKSYVSHIESGARSPSRKTLEKFCKLTDVPLDIFIEIGRDEDEGLAKLHYLTAQRYIRKAQIKRGMDS